MKTSEIIRKYGVRRYNDLFDRVMDASKAVLAHDLISRMSEGEISAWMQMFSDEAQTIEGYCMECDKYCTGLKDADGMTYSECCGAEVYQQEDLL